VPEQTVRLTQLSHGGGCGCKIAPAVLQKILAGTAPDTLEGVQAFIEKRPPAWKACRRPWT